MLEYRNELRIAYRASQGRDAEDGELELQYPSAVDREIIRLAGRELRGRALQTFAWLYSCKHSWEAVQEMFLKHLAVEIQVDAVQRYGRDAKKRMLDRMSGNSAVHRPFPPPRIGSETL